MNRLLAPQPRTTPDKLTMTPAEFGFMHHEPGPDFDLAALDLPQAYQNIAEGNIGTQLLVTDQQNPVLVTSLIGQSPPITRIAAKIESKGGENQYSDETQGYFLKGVKSAVDDNGAGNKTVSNNPNTIYYRGNVGTSNGRILRVYFAVIGSYEGMPIIAKVGACRTKESEVKLLRALGTNITKKVV